MEGCSQKPCSPTEKALLGAAIQTGLSRGWWEDLLTQQRWLLNLTAQVTHKTVSWGAWGPPADGASRGRCFEKTSGASAAPPCFWAAPTRC